MAKYRKWGAGLSLSMAWPELFHMYADPEWAMLFHPAQKSLMFVSWPRKGMRRRVCTCISHLC